MSPRVPQVGGHDDLLRAALRAAVQGAPGAGLVRATRVVPAFPVGQRAGA